MNKDLLGMDYFEDDADDLFPKSSFSDPHRMFSGKDCDMSEEEKKALISKNKAAIIAAVKEFVNSNVEIRRLLVIYSPGKTIDSASNEDLQYADSMSYNELVDAGYIVHEIESDVLDKNKEKVHCILSVSASETSVDFTVFCDYEYWHLDNYRARPVEIQKIIYSAFNGKEGILSKKLNNLSCLNMAIRDDVGAVIAIYNESHSLFSMDDEDGEDDKEFPLNHYEDILQVVVDRLVNNTAVKKHIGRGDAERMSLAELIDKGYVRLVQKVSINEDDPDQYLIIYLENRIGLELHFNIISKNSTSMTSDGKDKNKAILRCIKYAMSMIPGVEAKGSPSNYELNGEWTLYNVFYSVEYSEETLNTVINEENRKRVKPRFFVDIDTMNQALDLKLTDEEFQSNEIQELHIDITDVPYYIWLRRMGDGKELTIYERSEFHISYDHEGIEKGRLILSKENGTKGTASEGSIGENLGAFFKASMLVSKYFLKSDYVNDIDLVNFDEEGFMISVSDDEIHFKRVTGKARPSMMCTSMFNPTRRMRPYIDEIWDTRRMKNLHKG